ncbi:hypothetical protein SS1G_11708 [Sclerotinia sclerotiorum 1980 UF-70]|uniref:Uncharacterized protein n=1 Tax=Sclerotinia sclerotiorum (strain ATCC 18683 / 1980 / Ss-1) TaxID=665079 RepID=A7F362_SCLS1|nr:hypothetical protein SS1G_11708 [Sclerotinia sclerotiorum 1980 UF-70]EDN97183.1 hypothetical protein SS1G_11708 [Sclerotinia sclerotiorum 1980 UF-70]
MQQFIQTRDYQRSAINGYLDKEGQTYNEVGERLYNCCNKGVSDWITNQIRTAQEMQRFENKINEGSISNKTNHFESEYDSTEDIEIAGGVESVSRFARVLRINKHTNKTE